MKPIISTSMNSQIDLVNFQSNPDGKFNFILNYRDHLTKFVVLRAVRLKTAFEAAIRFGYISRNRGKTWPQSG